MYRRRSVFFWALSLWAFASVALGGGDAPAAKPEILTNSIGMKLVKVPAGEFLMGAPESDKDAQPDEKPQHKVKITKPFSMGVYTVTVGQFRAFIKDSGHEIGRGAWRTITPALKLEPATAKHDWANSGFAITDEHPVVNVNYPDAEAFCKWLSKKEGKTYRLPTEAEWEYACRAGTTTRWSCGDDRNNLVEFANIAYDSFPKYARSNGPKSDLYLALAPVGKFKPNPWGLCDMHGNVWQWCADWYAEEYYQKSPAADPTGAAKGASDMRVLRGGNFARGPLDCRSSNRIGLTAGNSLWIGFRVVAEIEEGKPDRIEPKKPEPETRKHQPEGRLPTTVTEENYHKIQAAVGKWSEADVLALLGPAHRFRITGKGTLNMIWEDASRIRVEFIKGKSTYLWGQFAKQIPSKTLNLENFRKLREGMTVNEVKAILGPDFDEYSGTLFVRGVGPFDELTVPEGTTLIVWQKVRRIMVQFSDGKVSGYTWTDWFMVKD